MNILVKLIIRIDSGFLNINIIVILYLPKEIWRGDFFSGAKKKSVYFNSSTILL